MFDLKVISVLYVCHLLSFNVTPKSVNKAYSDTGSIVSEVIHVLAFSQPQDHVTLIYSTEYCQGQIHGSHWYDRGPRTSPGQATVRVLTCQG